MSSSNGGTSGVSGQRRRGWKYLRHSAVSFSTNPTSTCQIKDHRYEWHAVEEEVAYLTNQRNLEWELKVLQLITGMPIIQYNGQRHTGPPPRYHGPIPAKGCEVYIGGLPRDCYEPELLPLLQDVGRVYLLRLMMDLSGTNRGFCFVQFFTPEEATAAIHAYNKYEIRPGRLIGVVRSVDNCRLLISGINKKMSVSEVFDELKKLTQGVARVMFDSPVSGRLNRGSAIVEYESHRAAAMARRILVPSGFRMQGKRICVDWANPNGDTHTYFA